jgi:hypothetical protein
MEPPESAEGIVGSPGPLLRRVDCLQSALRWAVLLGVPGLLVAIGCGDPGDPGRSASHGPTTPGSGLYAELTFPTSCTGRAVDVIAGGYGFGLFGPLDADCEALSGADEMAADVEAECLAAGASPTDCGYFAGLLVDEAARLAAKVPVVEIELVPLEPGLLATRGSAAELVWRLEDGSEELWWNGEVGWGERFVELEPDGTITAQGARNFDAISICDVVRDHTFEGLVEEAGVLSGTLVEVNTLTCELMGLTLEYRNTLATPTGGAAEVASQP